MLIEEISEKNFKEKIEEGNKRVELKLKKFENQIGDVDTRTRKGIKSEELTQSVDWYKFLDPTIFAYKLLTDKQDNQLKLRGFQDKIINDKHPRILCAAANQAGKTTTVCVKAIHHACLVPYASVLIISRSEQQSIYILDEIRWMLRRAKVPFKSVIDEVENRTEFHITNFDKKGVSVIRCLPPTQRVLAYPATLIVCDEIGFWDIEGGNQLSFFEKVIVSRIQETQHWKPKVGELELSNYFTMGQIICVSSTNAQQGIMWHLWNESDYNHYRYCWLSNPLNTLEKYKVLKDKKPSDVFDSVYAAVFSSATGGFITGAEYTDAERDYIIQPNNTRFLGGDFAGEDTVSRGVDETLLFGVEHAKEEKIMKVKVSYYKEFPLRTKKSVVYEKIKEFENISKFAYDRIGVGDSVKNDLKDRGILSEYKIEALTYSLPNKSEVYYNLKHLFEQRLLILPKGLDKLKEQLLGLRFERTQGGHMTKPLIKIHHASEGIHDDWADALANACYAAKRLMGTTPSITIIEKTKQPNQLNKIYTFVCPECEKEGKEAYYEAYNPNKKHFEKVNCPVHTTI